MLHTNYFVYGVTQSLGDTAAAYALTAARWGVLGFTWYTDAFFSAAAARRYRAIGQCIGFAVVVAVGLGMSARRYLQHWADGEVAAALTSDHIVDATTMVDPFCPSTNPLPVAPVTPALIGATLASLRKQCIAYNATLPNGDPRRIARAARLTKSEAIAALRMAA